MKENALITFAIHLNKSKLRDTPTDEHILKSDNFAFKDIGYQLDQISEGITTLRLTCHYTINSKMNWYAHFWANLIIADFEERLLNALKVKIERGAAGTRD